MTILNKVTAVAALALAACARPAMAGEKVHTVDSGDSASSIAAKFYGEKELGDFLLRYNGKAGTVIHEGEKLRIPYCDVHKVGKGDTWSTLSTKHLEKTSAYPAIASLNGFAAGAALPAGGQIVIPVVLSLKLESGESLASLAARWYGDPNRADLLQLFNDVDDPKRLSVGETVRIPLASIRLRKSAAADLPQKKPAPVRLARAATPGSDKNTAQAPATNTPVEKPSGDSGKSPAKAATAAKTPAPAKARASDPNKPAPAKTSDKAPAKTAVSEKPSNKAPAKTAVSEKPSDKAPAKTAVAEKPSDKAPAKPATPDKVAGKTVGDAKGTAPKQETGAKEATLGPSARSENVADPANNKDKVEQKTPAAAVTAPSAPIKTVEVPVLEPTVQSSAPQFRKEIDAAAKAFAEGSYGSARQLLESLRERSRTDGTEAERIEIMRLLAFVYVAFDMRTEACIAYNSLPMAEGSQTLDPDVVSPRIRDALSRCPAGKV